MSSNGQEGCHYKNSHIAQVATELDRQLRRAGLDVKIELTDAGSIYFLLDTMHPPDGRNQQLQVWRARVHCIHPGDWIVM